MSAIIPPNLSALIGRPYSASGQLVYSTGAGRWTVLPAGTDGYVLTVSSGVPAWVSPAAASGAVPLSTVTTAGDLIVADGSESVTRLGIGSNGQVLAVSGGALTWITPASGGDVVGPASATDNAIARFDTSTGKLLQNSAVTIDDSGNINLPSLAEVDGRDVSVDGDKLDSITSVGSGAIITATERTNLGTAFTHSQASGNPHSTSAADVGADPAGTASAAVAAHVAAADPHPGYVLESREAQANGIATLDGSGQVPLSQLGNVPAAPVTSVAGQTGVVTLDADDVSETVGRRWLATDAVVTTDLVDGAVTNAKLGADAVDGTKIADLAVDSEHIAAGAIDPAHLSATVATLQGRIGGYPVSAGDTTYEYWRAPFDATVVAVIATAAGAAITDTTMDASADPFGTPTSIFGGAASIVASEGGEVSPAISGTTYNIDAGDYLRVGVTGGGSATGEVAVVHLIYRRR